MKAAVDKDLCLGCGLCVDVCPDVFEMADDGKAVTKVDPVPPRRRRPRDAAEQCPVTAITVT